MSRDTDAQLISLKRNAVPSHRIREGVACDCRQQCWLGSKIVNNLVSNSLHYLFRESAIDCLLFSLYNIHRFQTSGARFSKTVRARIPHISS